MTKKEKVTFRNFRITEKAYPVKSRLLFLRHFPSENHSFQQISKQFANCLLLTP